MEEPGKSQEEPGKSQGKGTLFNVLAIGWNSREESEGRPALLGPTLRPRFC